MGLDCYSALIIGEKIIKKSVTAITTKYNEDNGKPYKKIVEKEKWFYEKDNKEFKDYEKFYESENDISILDCGIDDDIAYVGIIVCETPTQREKEPSLLVELNNIELLHSRFSEVFNRKSNLYMLTICDY